MISYMEYSAIYKDLAEQDFARFLFEAESLVDNWTAGRYKTAKGYKEEKVRRCLIRLIHEMGTPEYYKKGVKSVSNDGYSETYMVMAEDEIKAGYRAIAFEYLSGTGLLSYL